jgi:hypothetical protein
MAYTDTYWTSGTSSNTTNGSYYQTATTTADGSIVDYLQTCASGTSTYDTWAGPRSFAQYVPVQPTPEEIEADRIKEDEQKIADETARKLLLMCLDNFNKERFIAKKSIVVPSGLFEDISYHIQPHKADKIVVMQKDKVLDRMCIMPVHTGDEPFPNDDVVLSKVLHLTYNEEESIMVANCASNLQKMLEVKVT